MPAPTTPAADIAAAVEPLAAEPRSAAALFDLDGTLAPIVDRPDQAAVPADTRELIARVADSFSLAGVISGRRAADARRILGLRQIAYAGNHGFELLAPEAEQPVSSPALAGHEREVEAFLAELDLDAIASAGLRIEDKGAIRALHWRGAGDEEAAEQMAAGVGERATAAGLITHRGRKVLELRPPVRLDKGDAARALLDQEEVETALYAGDDRTDLDAFAALRSLQAEGRLQRAIAVAVLAEESPPEVAEAADVVVDGPAGFIVVLEALLRCS